MTTLLAGTTADTRAITARIPVAPTALKLAVQAALLCACTDEGVIGDGYFASVAALIPFNGANNSTAFTDVLGGVWTPSGTAKISTAQSKWGGASGYFDGTSDTATAGTGSEITGPSGASISGTGDFTIEFWMRPSALVSVGDSSHVRIIYDQRAGVGFYPALWIDGTTLNRLCYFVNGARVMTGSTTLVTNTWYHVALCRASGTTRLFLNGVLDGTWADSSNYIAATPVVGGAKSQTGFEYQGHLDDFRITKGVARYTADFTPPTAAFPDRYAEPSSTDGVVSLLHFNDTAGTQTFSDVLLKNWAVYGNTLNSATQSKFGGVSGYFDGTGDYLACASPDFGFGAGDWTWEGWVRPDSATGDGLFGNVSSLIHFEGANNSTVITDVTGKTWTASGDAKIVTSQFKWGTSCAFFDGTGDYISATANAGFAMGIGDFTFECWIRVDPAIGTWARLFENEQYDVSGGWHLSFNGSDSAGNRRLGFQKGNTGGGGSRIDTNVAVPTNTWVHFAAVRASGVTALYVNGVKQTATMADTDNYTSQKAVIGFVAGGTPSSFYYGYVDDLRLTKGVARYTANFTPPAAAFLDTAGGVVTSALFDTKALGTAGLAIYSRDTANGNAWGIKTNAGVTTVGSVLTADTWAHLAVAKQGSTIRGFKDGVLDFTYTDARTYALTALATVGANGSGAEFYKGHLDEMRVTKGVARYISAFAAPTAAFVDPTISEGGGGGGGSPTPVTHAYGFVS